MSFLKITEYPSLYRHLEKMSAMEIVKAMNEEDKKVADIVTGALPQIALLVDDISDRLIRGGRLFYLGAGTSGRLGVLDASECPPTFGVPANLVKGIIAGGNEAVFGAVEGAEDDDLQGWADLCSNNISMKDVVIGITASGTTPYVLGALKSCRANGILTSAIYCNPNAPVREMVHHPVELVVGPEFVTGSTRLKAGTAQKMALNMISTAVMIRLGRVEDNKMVDMQLTNEKLIARGIFMVMEKTGVTDELLAKKMLQEHGSVRAAVLAYLSAG
jgi:N-acetylmuramic acid 6-phosphate etherase